MKKFLSSILVLAMILGLIGCSGSAKNEEKKDGRNESPVFGLLTLDNSQQTGISDSDRIPEEGGVKDEELKKKRDNTKFIHYDNLTTAILGLDRGDIEVLQIPRPTCDYIMKKNEGKYSCANLGKKHIVLVMAAMNDRQDVIDEINKGLNAIMSNHKYDAIYKKYITYCNTESDEKIPHFDDAKTIKVAVTGDLPPFDYMSAAGEAQGFNVALLSAMADELHVNFELVACESGARAITASSGKADVIFWMSGETMDSEGNNVDYSNDVPKNMIVSDRYAIVPYSCLGLASNESLKNGPQG